MAATAWPRAELALGSDRASGLAAAFGDGDGIAVIAGTGSAVHGRRGGRIVAEMLGVSRDEAARRLAASGWNVRACLGGA